MLLAVVGWAALPDSPVDPRPGVTGMDRPSYWGMYIVNFIFLIGVSMAGTLISAALYLQRELAPADHTHCRGTTVFGLLIAGLQIMIDMGRPERGCC